MKDRQSNVIRFPGDRRSSSPGSTGRSLTDKQADVIHLTPEYRAKLLRVKELEKNWRGVPSAQPPVLEILPSKPGEEAGRKTNSDGAQIIELFADRREDDQDPEEDEYSIAQEVTRIGFEKQQYSDLIDELQDLGAYDSILKLILAFPVDHPALSEEAATDVEDYATDLAVGAFLSNSATIDLARTIAKKMLNPSAAGLTWSTIYETTGDRRDRVHAREKVTELLDSTSAYVVREDGDITDAELALAILVSLCEVEPDPKDLELARTIFAAIPKTGAPDDVWRSGLSIAEISGEVEDWVAAIHSAFRRNFLSKHEFSSEVYTTILDSLREASGSMLSREQLREILQRVENFDPRWYANLRKALLPKPRKKPRS